MIFLHNIVDVSETQDLTLFEVGLTLDLFFVWHMGERKGLIAWIELINQLKRARMKDTLINPLQKRSSESFCNYGLKMDSGWRITEMLHPCNYFIA